MFPNSLFLDVFASPSDDAAAGCGMQDAQIQDNGFEMQVVGCRIWVWDAGGGILGTGGGMEQVRCRI